MVPLLNCSNPAQRLCFRSLPSVCGKLQWSPRWERCVSLAGSLQLSIAVSLMQPAPLPSPFFQLQLLPGSRISHRPNVFTLIKLCQAPQEPSCWRNRKTNCLYQRMAISWTQSPNATWIIWTHKIYLNIYKHVPFEGFTPGVFHFN